MDQRSTILAVDNLNATKVLGRTIRVDHVHQYKLPKDLEKLDQDKKKLFEEGCAPKPIDPSESEEEDEDEVLPMKVKKEKKEKKKKKDKKHKKKKKRKYSTDSQIDSEEDIRDRHKIIDGRHDDRTMIDTIECQLETCLRRKTKEIKMVISETPIILETVSLEMIGEGADPEKGNIEVDLVRGGIEVDLVREGTTEVEETEDDHINKCT